MAKRVQAPSGEGQVEMSVEDYRARVKSSADKWEKLHAVRVDASFSWADASPADLRDMVAAVTADGSAVLLAVTSDGGALVIQVLNGKGRHKLYPTNEEELQEALVTVTRIAES